MGEREPNANRVDEEGRGPGVEPAPEPVSEVPAEVAEGAADPAQVIADLKERLAREAARAEELWHRLVRLQADFENFRRRTRAEREELLRYGAESLVRALLPVLDDFERALASGGGEGFVAGVEMIYRQLMDVLAREGLRPVESVGRPFDPTYHEGVEQEVTTAYPDNTVTHELRRGYFLHDRVIRPAL
ncbi:MAG: nucleotide exchange factor GrpE, partial [Firmicutes bacterium]|nr:nucleotide exchange factor GrpE [Bacillota bacterium]